MDLETILDKATTDVPKAFLVVQAECKKGFWWMIDNVPKHFSKHLDSDDCFPKGELHTNWKISLESMDWNR